MLEIARGAVGLIRMDGDQTIISRPPDQRTGKESEDVKAFTFDKSYWSADKNDPSYAGQQTVYNDMGEELLDHAFGGYNCCIFACKLFCFISRYLFLTKYLNKQTVKLVLVNHIQW